MARRTRAMPPRQNHLQWLRENQLNTEIPDVSQVSLLSLDGAAREGVGMEGPCTVRRIRGWIGISLDPVTYAADTNQQFTVAICVIPAALADGTVSPLSELNSMDYLYWTTRQIQTNKTGSPAAFLPTMEWELDVKAQRKLKANDALVLIVRNDSGGTGPHIFAGGSWSVLFSK